MERFAAWISALLFSVGSVLGLSDSPTATVESVPQEAVSVPIPSYTSVPTPTLTVSPLALERIFSSVPDREAYPQEQTIRLLATGDVIPARSVNTRMIRYGSFLWPFAKTREVLRDADLTVINLETPLLDGCPPTDTGMVFCGSARAVEGLVDAGVDIATLGNNHAGNFGPAGVEETKRHLTGAGIVPVAAGPAYTEVKGVRFAFLSYDDIGPKAQGVPWADIPTVQKEVGEAKKNADVVVVAYHWGVEYVRRPTPRQVELGHAAVDAGADLVLGNHPHWVQPVELYKGKLIVYAQGNFVFDQMWSTETRQGVVGMYTFAGTRLADVSYTPVFIEDYGQPRIAAGPEGDAILRQMQEDSQRLAGRESIGH